MAIGNLHSLLNQPWYIHQSYAEGHLPLLFNLLEGKAPVLTSKKKKPAFSLMDVQGSVFGEDGETDQKVVAVISLKTPIYKYSQECGPRGTKFHMHTLENLRKDDRVAGVVLDIDSGGGQVYGTPEFHDYIKEFNDKKPVVTYTDGLLCSAAYYIGSAASHIVANKRADAIGSIGAYAQFLDLEGYYEKKGAKVHTIYAEKSVDKNKSYRELLKGNYQPYIKEDLNPIVEDFIADIKAVRPGIDEEVFGGATYPGTIAFEKGLVDELGNLQTAVNKVFELSDKKLTNTNNTMSNKNASFPKIEEVLGLTEPLAVSENGSYLQDEQKTALETALTESAAEVKTAQDAQATAEQALEKAQEDHKAELDAEKANSTASVTQLRELATLAGVEGLAEEATAEQISTALTARINEMNREPGETHTGAIQEDPKAGEHAYLNLNSSIYDN